MSVSNGLEEFFAACHLHGGLCALGRDHEGGCKTYECLVNERAERAEAKLDAILAHVESNDSASSKLHRILSLVIDRRKTLKNSEASGLEAGSPVVQPDVAAPERKLDVQGRPGMPGTPEPAEQPSPRAEARESPGANLMKVPCIFCKGSGIGSTFIYGEGEMTVCGADRCAHCQGLGTIEVPEECDNCGMIEEPLDRGHCEGCICAKCKRTAIDCGESMNEVGWCSQCEASLLGKPMKKSKAELNEAWGVEDTHHDLAKALYSELAARDTKEGIRMLADVFRQREHRPVVTLKTGPRTPAEAVIFAEANARVDFQHRLQTLLNRSKLSRKELADQVGLSEDQIDHLFYDDANPGIQMVARIFNVLDAHIKESVESVLSYEGKVEDRFRTLINDTLGSGYTSGTWFVAALELLRLTFDEGFDCGTTAIDHGFQAIDQVAANALLERITKGRKKYPQGCTAISLWDEAGEVVHAINKYESIDRVRDEILDVAAVAMRLYMGEIDYNRSISGLAQVYSPLEEVMKKV